jgi:hypothetical protein
MKYLWQAGVLLIVAGVSFEIFCRWWARRQQRKRLNQLKGHLKGK